MRRRLVKCLLLTIATMQTLACRTRIIQKDSATSKDLDHESSDYQKPLLNLKTLPRIDSRDSFDLVVVRSGIDGLTPEEAWSMTLSHKAERMDEDNIDFVSKVFFRAHKMQTIVINNAFFAGENPTSQVFRDLENKGYEVQILTALTETHPVWIKASKQGVTKYLSKDVETSNSKFSEMSFFKDSTRNPIYQILMEVSYKESTEGFLFKTVYPTWTDARLSSRIP